ncbi:MAG: hypothetical protein EZS28_021463 [Streblomastix strix]|uniref:Cysteine protease n=1 Tax=Streblomastix strix TaxID=222440 RepID=A0A5J4VKK4_9EUKA|nr:MAG: hypothetical protein EZS28_021463 [Streblomastix strix]
MNIQEAFVLGHHYCQKPKNEKSRKITDLFIDVNRTYVWASYRKGFPSFEGRQLQSDRGWGCVVRSMQMMLAEALKRHFRLVEEQSEKQDSSALFRYNIIKNIFDNEQSPFSLHNICKQASITGNKIGVWFSPSEAGIAIENLTHKSCSSELPNIIVIKDMTLNKMYQIQ